MALNAFYKISGKRVKGLLLFFFERSTTYDITCQSFKILTLSHSFLLRNDRVNLAYCFCSNNNRLDRKRRGRKQNGITAAAFYKESVNPLTSLTKRELAN